MTDLVEVKVFLPAPPDHAEWDTDHVKVVGVMGKGVWPTATIQCRLKPERMVAVMLTESDRQHWASYYVPPASRGPQGTPAARLFDAARKAVAPARCGQHLPDTEQERTARPKPSR